MKIFFDRCRLRVTSKTGSKSDQTARAIQVDVLAREYVARDTCAIKQKICRPPHTHTRTLCWIASTTSRVTPRKKDTKGAKTHARPLGACATCEPRLC